jgi:hypothetical protein
MMWQVFLSIVKKKLRAKFIRIQRSKTTSEGAFVDRSGERPGRFYDLSVESLNVIKISMHQQAEKGCRKGRQARDSWGINLFLLEFVHTIYNITKKDHEAICLSKKGGKRIRW